ncbi:MAG TPA: ketoacyl-ACP synthase III [Thermoanaerobaculia bacterium]|nr:ketoacyl-ACP synthase III [Thermoanaerobaculia bacterium]
MMPIYIAGMGCSIPKERLTNQELIKTLDTSEEWIEAHTGILERRRANTEVDTSDLGVDATRSALAAARWPREELELLICATCTPDTQVPSTAALIGRKLGIDPICFDLNAACSGFVFGLATAASMMAHMGFRRAALCNAEKFTKVTDYQDRRSAIFFGDSSATVLLERERPAVGFEIVDLALASCNEGTEYVQIPLGGYFVQDGRKVKDYALRHFYRSASEILERNDVRPKDLRAFVGHQANLRLLEQVVNRLGLSEEQHWSNVRWIGNQGSAGVITTFCTRVAQRATQLDKGDLFLLTVFGAGFTSGSVLLRWVGESQRTNQVARASELAVEPPSQAAAVAAGP